MSDDIHRSLLGYMIAGLDPLFSSKQVKPLTATQPIITKTNPIVRTTMSNSPELLGELKKEVEKCQLCPLAKTRINTVFGQGNPNAKLCFIGEAPGAEEDEQGLAFVGRAGQLLTRMVTAMKLARDDVFIHNLLKCRPPGNRNPLPDEIDACQHFLARQLTIIRPQVIVALGLFSAQWLLNSKDALGRMRGHFHAIPEERHFGLPDTKIMVTYHPAACLRFPDYKKSVWEDLQKVMVELGIS